MNKFIDYLGEKIEGNLLWMIPVIFVMATLSLGFMALTVMTYGLPVFLTMGYLWYDYKAGDKDDK